MIEPLKQVANEIANSRVRLAHPLLGNQTKQDILDEVKNMENIESQLRCAISELEIKVKEILNKTQ